uniref:BSD domain-containing protein n=1 Tax=Rhabditophanes sp. KR3021 TaxID=114890 RepID=A0AC35TNS5_9BILA
MNWLSNATKNISTYVSGPSNPGKLEGTDLMDEPANFVDKQQQPTAFTKFKSFAKKTTNDAYVKANEWKEYMNETAVVKDDDEEEIKPAQETPDQESIGKSTSFMSDLSVMARKASKGAAEKATKLKEYVNEMTTSVDEEKQPESSESIKTSSVINDISKYAKKAGEVTVRKASELKKYVDEVAKESILGDLERENEAYIAEIEKEKLRSITEYPWIGMPNEALAHKRILSLSLDPKNFTGHVPEYIGYSANEIDALAAKMIDADQNLRSMRLNLVPTQINEDKFWQNYAYKVYVVRKILLEEDSEDRLKEMNLTDLPNEEEKIIEASSSPGKESSLDTDDWEKELLNDLDFDVVMAKTGNKSNEEWEAEIDAILNEETKN